MLPAGGSIYWTESLYDELDRVYETRYPHLVPQEPDSSSTIAYGLASGVSCAGAVVSGLETLLVDQKERERREIRDARGKLICTIEEMGSEARFEYDAEGLLLTAWNLLGTTPIAVQTNVYARPGPGYLVSRTDADMGTWTFRHDALGQLQQQDDANGQTLSMTYDRLGRTKTRLEPEGLTVWTWDTAANGVGQLAAVSSPETTYFATYAYDVYGRPVTTSKRIGTTSYEVTRQWDSAGRLDTIDYPHPNLPAGLSVRYGYNASGYVYKVYDAATPSQPYWQATKVDAYGNVTEEVLGSQGTTERLFDAARGLPRAIKTTNEWGAYEIQDLEYDWDEVASLTRRESIYHGLEETFTYDDLNRLETISLNSQLSQQMSYDTLGNITTKGLPGGPTWSYWPTRPHAVMSTGDTLYQYDGNGNETSASGSRSRESTYRSHNKPCNISRGETDYESSFFYGPDRELIMSIDASSAGSVTHTYIDDLFEFEDGYSGGPADTYINYVRVSGRLIATVSHNVPSGTLRELLYYHWDHLGSVDAVTKADASVKQWQSYDPWGRRRNSSSWVAVTPYFFASRPFQDSGVTPGFGGHQALDHLELVHMGGRVYDPFMGRFMTPDPVVQFAASGQGWNAYAYVGNNPLSAMDPSGYSWKSFWQGVFKAWKTFWKGVFKTYKTFTRVIFIVGNAITNPAAWGTLPVLLTSSAERDALLDNAWKAYGKPWLISSAFGILLAPIVGPLGAAISSAFQVASEVAAVAAKTLVGALSGALNSAVLGENPLRGAYQAAGFAAAFAGLEVAAASGVPADQADDPSGDVSQSGTYQDANGNPASTLTEAQQAQAEKWAQQSREGIVGIFDSNRAPAPRNWEIESITVSRTVNADDPLMRASNDIGTRISAGIEVQVGRITIYPPGAGSFESVFIRVGHEIGHFFPHGTFTESQLTAYGTALWNVYNGGTYSGPQP
jgi:RHS repeat-associated protein